jgi:hypothetical protein
VGGKKREIGNWKTGKEKNYIFLLSMCFQLKVEGNKEKKKREGGTEIKIKNEKTKQSLFSKGIFCSLCLRLRDLDEKKK